MKLKYEFIVRNIVDEFVLVPVGTAALDFAGMITTTEVGALLVEALKNHVTKEELVEKVTAEYDIDAETAKADIDEFIQKLDKLDLIEY